MKPSEIINMLRFRRSEIAQVTLELQQDAFKPEPGAATNENLVERNAGQIKRLTESTEGQLGEIDKVIEDAKALRSELATSLAAWKAAAAVLEAPHMPLASRIKEAAAETDAAAVAVARTAGKARPQRVGTIAAMEAEQAARKARKAIIETSPFPPTALIADEHGNR
jgi:hypothetical protein